MFSTEFLLTSLVVVLIPGTGVIYTMTNGLFRGRMESVAAALGCTAGIIPHLLAGIFGLSAILHMSALAFQVIKFAGVLYLLYLAWGMWHDKGGMKFDSEAKKEGYLQIVRRGVLINILNPKLTIFFLAFLPQFLSSDSTLSTTAQLFSMSAIFMAMTFVVFVLYGLFANYVSSFLTASGGGMRKIQRLFALIFASLGLKLAFSE